MFDVLWLVIALLVVLLLLFVLVDWYLKRGNQKKADKPAAKTETPKPTAAKEKAIPEAAPTTVALPSMNVYNSNLADDLDAMLKAGNSQSVRQERTNKITTKGHIADYVAAKNYHTFSFDVDPNEDVDQSTTFTKEDYKKFVALSNIDDKK